MAPGPVCTTYTKPRERVLFSPTRDANPFFHFMEALWMLNGDEDVAWPSFFATNIKNYSDDGERLHGAYGYRWRRTFGIDQLDYVIKELKKHPDSRRAVLGMWDPSIDIDMALRGGKDVPCNTHVYFSLRGGQLDMLVSCRSNDIIWGAYGANVVHFSALMEYIAACLGVKVGLYRQLSYNYHVYIDKYPEEVLRKMAIDSQGYNEYSRALALVPFMEPAMSKEEFDRQLARFMLEPEPAFNDDCLFLGQVARPMYRAWVARKTKTGNGMEQAQKIAAADWRIACTDWIQRRDRDVGKAA